MQTLERSPWGKLDAIVCATLVGQSCPTAAESSEAQTLIHSHRKVITPVWSGNRRLAVAAYLRLTHLFLHFSVQRSGHARGDRTKEAAASALTN